MIVSPDLAEFISRFILDRLSVRRETAGGPCIIGICGAQGIGKTTVTANVAHRLEALGHKACILSLDDLYLSLAERQRLAETVHPLLATRGVPGTHDPQLGLQLFADCATPGQISVPQFDKALDDRLPREDWPMVKTPVDVVLFEGWCVGAMPQSAAALSLAANALERDEDPDGVWRGYVNNALATSYQQLFAQLDDLILLAAPSFEIVAAWRGEQEAGLAQRLGSAADLARRTMNTDEIARFVLYYERLTCHILAEMPSRASLVLRLDQDRRLIAVEEKTE